MKQFKIISTAAGTSIVIYKDSSKAEADRFTIAYIDSRGTEQLIYADGYPLPYAYKLADQAAKVVNKRLTAQTA